MPGYINIHRQIKNNWIWQSDNRLKWWIDILLTVNHAETKVLIKGNLICCERGQSVRSLETWAKDWNVTKKTVSDFFKLLQKDNMILIENLKITTRITVCKYDEYNNPVNAKETQKKRTVNAEVTESKRTLPTNNNDKNDNNEKNIYGSEKNVSLTNEEIEKLRADYNGQTEKAIEYLSVYKKEKDYKTKSDYLTIKRWVIDAVSKQKELNKQGDLWKIPDNYEEIKKDPNRLKFKRN